MVTSVVLGHEKSWMIGLPTLGCFLACVSFSQVLLLLQYGSILFQFFLNFSTFNPGLALPVSAAGRGGQGAEIRKDLDKGIFQQFQKHYLKIIH